LFASKKGGAVAEAASVARGMVKIRLKMEARPDKFDAGGARLPGILPPARTGGGCGRRKARTVDHAERAIVCGQ
jgi:hypothetical protein